MICIIFNQNNLLLIYMEKIFSGVEKIFSTSGKNFFYLEEFFFQVESVSMESGQNGKNKRPGRKKFFPPQEKFFSTSIFIFLMNLCFFPLCGTMKPEMERKSCLTKTYWKSKKNLMR